MSKPKKPGTDLAALKARLAKKTKGADAPPAEAAPDVPPPGQVVPPPGQAAAPMADVPPPGHVPAPMADVPPPGHVPAPEVPPPGQAMPVADVPPPGHVPAPEPQQPVAAPMPQQQAPMAAPMPQQQPIAPTQADDNPFGGSVGMDFDPDAGLIDGGPEIKPRGGKGIVLFAALLAAGVGAVGGWLGHKIVSTQEKIDQGKAKGEKMVVQVSKISDARKSVSLAMEDLKKEIATDPAGSADKVSTLISENFGKQPQVSELFGWQLASVDPIGVKSVFQLYDKVSQLQENLGLMSGVLRNYGKVMKVGGPTLYGLTFGPSGGRMIAVDEPLCGTPPAEGEEFDPATLKPCGSEGAKAIAYKVRDSPGGKPAIMMRGIGENQAVLLLAEGKVYEYAIGIEQGNNAANFYKLALSRVEESLAEMDKAEERALKSLKKYAEDPNVDGSQPAPQDGG